MKKLLYFFPNESPFVDADFEILSKKYTVCSFNFKPRTKWHTPFSFVAQLIFILFRIFQTKIFFSQFSGYHTFLPSILSKILNVPHYIVLNGTECNNFPEIDYGFLNRPVLFWFSKKSLQWSTRLFPVSESLVSADYTYMPTKYVHQGFSNFYKPLNTPYTVIHNGISIDRFQFDPTIVRDKNSFITIASGLELQKRWLVKGLDLIIELAKVTPENTYTFVGTQKPIGISLPSNITVVDFVPHQELSTLYNRHRFYLQLSVSEGFGISVCEAMLCGCVPIVSDVGMLPFIVGRKGYVLQHKNLVLLENLVQRAIKEFNTENSIGYRQHILDHFPLSVRAEKLLDCLSRESKS
ncbi:MAG: glycosyltransferase family 4 protein [Saprospiraceae bacterium]